MGHQAFLLLLSRGTGPRQWFSPPSYLAALGRFASPPSRPNARPVRGERGQALIELTVVLPFYLLIIAALIFFGRAIYTQIALDMAAYDGCRAAVEALDPGDGIHQGLTTMRATLQGFRLNAQAATLAISGDSWERGSLVRCDAAYNLFVGDIWLKFHQGPTIYLRSTVWSRIETWRSDWK